MYTTLNKIKSHDPCARGWRTLLAALGKTKADDDPVSMAFILQSNGFEDAVWTFKCLAGADREIRLFSEELDAAWDAARAAAWDAADAARDTAWDTAWAAARDTAWAAARDTARAKQEELFLKYFG